MKVLVVSDTHGKSQRLDEVISRERPFDAFIHCGDVEGQEDYLQAALECPVYIVAGNNDFFSDLDRELEVELNGVRMMVTHGHNYGVSLDLSGLMEEVASRAIPLALFGHTHRPVICERNGVTVINPGSLSYPRQEGRKPSYAVLSIENEGKFSCEIKFLGKEKNQKRC